MFIQLSFYESNSYVGLEGERCTRIGGGGGGEKKGTGEIVRRECMEERMGWRWRIV